MIEIKSTSERDLEMLSYEFFKLVKNSISKKINKINEDWLREFLSKNLQLIIAGKPAELILLNREYKKCASKNSKKPSDFDAEIKKVFNYKWLVGDKQRAYEFASKLQVNCCPYCNRNYTVTVLDTARGVVRPDFDHFFSKSKFPLLALSFYNLIPSCPLCNRSIKGSQKMEYNKYIHPYEEGFGSALRINYIAKDADSMIGVKSNIKISVLLSSTDKEKAVRCNNSFKLFKLKEIYEISHVNEISDIIRKFHISGGRYLEVLQKQFPDLGTTDELYQVAFGNFYNEDDFGKKPLAKLTKDIVDQLSFVVPKIK